MTICLNMIVKNESHCIERCLNSLKHFIDYYVICDTGSTDDTKIKIKECLKDIKGELIDLEWKNFEDTRNESLRLARNKSDFIFLMDADDILEGNLSNIPNNYNAFYIKMFHGDIIYPKIKLISNDLLWKYIGKTHEVLNHPNPIIGEINQCYIQVTNDGARRKTNEKFIQDLVILDNDEETSRNVFYKAQTLKDLKCYKLAISEYEKRVLMQGWQEEVFYSLYMIADCMLYSCKYCLHDLIAAYTKAYMHSRSRFEPLYKLMYLLRIHGMSKLAIEFYNLKQKNNNSLFVEPKCEELCKKEYEQCLNNINENS